jgi:hypothetical protein
MNIVYVERNKIVLFLRKSEGCLCKSIWYLFPVTFYKLKLSEVFLELFEQKLSNYMLILYGYNKLMALLIVLRIIRRKLPVSQIKFLKQRMTLIPNEHLLHIQYKSAIATIISNHKRLSVVKDSFVI